MTKKTKNGPSFSFWETQTYFTNIDLIVIGSGIVGLNAAISYHEKYPKSKILVLDRGILPLGASTKNAGFACFGSVSELQADLKNTSEDSVWKTVEMRIKGLELLRNRLSDKQINYKEFGGFELFDNKNSFEKCVESIDEFNHKIKSFVGYKNTYSIASNHIKHFQFKNVKGLILNRKEGQIDTGMMISNLIKLANSKGIIILNSIAVNAINDLRSGVALSTSIGDLRAKHIIVATNAFANELLKIDDLKPARAQVLITKPLLRDLQLKAHFTTREVIIILEM